MLSTRRLPPFAVRLAEWFVPNDAVARAVFKRDFLRILITANFVLGAYYLLWRVSYSVNLSAWYIALPLLAAEFYSFFDALLFGLTMWRLKRRPPPPPPPPGATVDVFITCYNEPMELVRQTVRAALAIRYPHTTFVLDDGRSPEMLAMTQAEGAGYLVRSDDWRNRERHAKAGNLNNALFQTTGEYVLILDADQIPFPEILDHTLGYFRDPKIGFVQTPQWFYNVPPGDPLGSDAPLFYGPILQGKDGWGAAFFCGSNAILRREALMQHGIVTFVRELEERVRRALNTSDNVLNKAERQVQYENEHTRAAFRELHKVVHNARTQMKKRVPIQQITWDFQRRIQDVSRLLVTDDLNYIQSELAGIPGVDMVDFQASMGDLLQDPHALNALTGRESSPLAAIGAVRGLLLAVDVDRHHEAQPIMPIATISVTEDMATAMGLHSIGWQSAYHSETLARGLAPEDLRTALQQRLRWAQGTLQVMFRNNPWFLPGLTLGQRIMYGTTMWSYSSGFASLVYLLAPILYLLFGILPVRGYSNEFFWHLLPYLVSNQLVFIVVGWGLQTWRGQQYSLALFPLWIRAFTSVLGNIFLGRKLGFVVTAKTRQQADLGIIKVQLIVMGLLVFSVIWGLARLALGLVEDGLPIAVNVFWAIYDLVALSALLDGVFYQPREHSPFFAERSTIGAAHGRAGAGSR